jgi:hypothetical protein
MMFVSPHLKFDPTRSLTGETEPLCGMRAEIPPEVNRATLRAGQWWVYPLARGADNILFGLRLTPGVAMKDSAVVVADRAQAATIASSPAYLVPTRLHGTLRRGGEKWDELASLPPRKWKALVALHHTLGGDDDLDEVRKLVRDKAVKKLYETGDYRALVTTQCEWQQRLDRAPETAAYARYLVRAVTEKVAPTPTPDAGCWNAALATLALWMSQHDPDEQPHRDAELWSAWRVVHQLPGLDSSRGTGTEVGWTPGPAVELQISAAKVVTKRKDKAWASDLLLPAVEKLAASKKYDGAAHLAAATALDKARDPAGAFTALMAAAYWRVQARGEADVEVLGTARKLARKAKWEIADALDEIFETQEQLEAES